MSLRAGRRACGAVSGKRWGRALGTQYHVHMTVLRKKAKLKTQRGGGEPQQWRGSGPSSLRSLLHGLHRELSPAAYRSPREARALGEPSPRPRPSAARACALRPRSPRPLEAPPPRSSSLRPPGRSWGRTVAREARRRQRGGDVPEPGGCRGGSGGPSRVARRPGPRPPSGSWEAGRRPAREQRQQRRQREQRLRRVSLLPSSLSAGRPGGRGGGSAGVRCPRMGILFTRIWRLFNHQGEGLGPEGGRGARRRASRGEGPPLSHGRSAGGAAARGPGAGCGPRGPGFGPTSSSGVAPGSQPFVLGVLPA